MNKYIFLFYINFKLNFYKSKLIEKYDFDN